MKRKHEYHGLWWHFGRYGPQDVHMHPCVTHEHCSHELQGLGWDCKRGHLHRQVRYVKGEWVAESEEGRE